MVRTKAARATEIRTNPHWKKKMPSVLIEVRRQYSHEQEIAIIEAVHLSLREAFKILPGDKNVRLVVT